MNGADFINLAGKIVTFGDAGSRSATSRAYYGAMHTALEFFAELGVEFKQQESHSLPHQCLNAIKNENAKVAGRLLGDLQSRRIKADYKLENVKVDVIDFGKRSVESAATIANELDELLQTCKQDITVADELVEKSKSLVALKRGR